MSSAYYSQQLQPQMNSICGKFQYFNKKYKLQHQHQKHQQSSSPINLVKGEQDSSQLLDPSNDEEEDNNENICQNQQKLSQLPSQNIHDIPTPKLCLQIHVTISKVKYLLNVAEGSDMDQVVRLFLKENNLNPKLQQSILKLVNAKIQENTQLNRDKMEKLKQSDRVHRSLLSSSKSRQKKQKYKKGSKHLQYDDRQHEQQQYQQQAKSPTFTQRYSKEKATTAEKNYQQQILNHGQQKQPHKYQYDLSHTSNRHNNHYISCVGGSPSKKPVRCQRSPNSRSASPKHIGNKYEQLISEYYNEHVQNQNQHNQQFQKINSNSRRSTHHHNNHSQQQKNDDLSHFVAVQDYHSASSTHQPNHNIRNQKFQNINRNKVNSKQQQNPQNHQNMKNQQQKVPKKQVFLDKIQQRIAQSVGKEEDSQDDEQRSYSSHRQQDQSSKSSYYSQHQHQQSQIAQQHEDKSIQSSNMNCKEVYQKWKCKQKGKGKYLNNNAMMTTNEFKEAHLLKQNGNRNQPHKHSNKITPSKKVKKESRSVSRSKSPLSKKPTANNSKKVISSKKIQKQNIGLNSNSSNLYTQRHFDCQDNQTTLIYAQDYDEYLALDHFYTQGQYFQQLKRRNTQAKFKELYPFTTKKASSAATPANSTPQQSFINSKRSAAQRSSVIQSRSKSKSVSKLKQQQLNSDSSICLGKPIRNSNSKSTLHDKLFRDRNAKDMNKLSMEVEHQGNQIRRYDTSPNSITQKQLMMNNLSYIPGISEKQKLSLIKRNIEIKQKVGNYNSKVDKQLKTMIQQGSLQKPFEIKRTSRSPFRKTTLY